VGTVTPNSDAHPQNVGKINVGFITARSVAGDIDANTMVVAGISTFVGAINGPAINVTSVVSSGAVSGTTATFTGGILLDDSISHIGDTDTKIRFSAANTVSMEVNGSEGFKVDTSGTTLTSTTDASLFINTTNSSGSHIRLQTSGTNKTFFGQAEGIAGSLGGANDFAIRSTEDIIFSTNNDNTPNMVLDASSRLGIQGAPTKGVLDVRASGGSATMLTAVFGANEGQTGGSLSDNADKGGRVGLYHYDIDEEPFALFQYGAGNGTNALNFGGGTSLMNAATSLGFYTAANSTTTNGTKRMTIDSSGNTHFGSQGLNDSNVVSIIPADGRISFGMDGRDSLVTGESGAYIFSGEGSSGSPLAGELILQSRSNVDRDIFFATGSSPTFRARFRGSDGDFFLGNDLPVITSVGTAFRENDGSLQTYMEMGHSATGANYSYFICRHGGSGTNIGGIAQNSSGNGVTFNTSSDYRLKENVVNITDGITRIKQLTPRRFNWISDETNTLQDGFIAHEVSSIIPEAITGTKDAVETTYYEEEKNLPEGKSVGDVKETNRPVYQSIDQSKLVPLLTAALQEAIAEIDALKTRVTTLEGS